MYVSAEACCLLSCYFYATCLEFPPFLQDFGANSIHVYETLKHMVPPHISSNVKPNLIPKAMRPGCKIIPKGALEPPRHATNSRLLKWSMASGGSSPGSSLSGISPQSSGKCRNESLEAVDKELLQYEHIFIHLIIITT